MNNPSYIVASKVKWNEKHFDQFSNEKNNIWNFASTPTELDKLLEVTSPRYIFFPHWSWIVSKEVVKKYECICFHMTDLPFGRGGSPLQNLIVQGYKETMLTALKMEEGVDTGPIYYKKSLSLHGTAHDIYKRSEGLCWDMINDFVADNPDSVSQKGVVTNFKRRTPEQSRLPEGLSLEEVYNYIRMLDAPGYPKAFLEMNDYRLEFESSSYVDGRLSAKVSFIKGEGSV
jgi:methionyl-tRNA formyltransferase